MLVSLMSLAACAPQQLDMEQLMEEAEDYFATELSATNPFDLYPVSMTVSAGEHAETWPAFRNTKNVAVDVTLLVDCPVENIQYQNETLSVKPGDEQVFALIVDTAGVPAGSYECTLMLRENDALLAPRTFVFAVE